MTNEAPPDLFDSNGATSPTVHEHRGYWPFRTLIRSRALIEINRLVDEFHRHPNDINDVGSFLESIANSTKNLDNLSLASRKAILGDSDPLAETRKWLQLQLDGDQLITMPSSCQKAPTGNDILQASHWVQPSGLMDLVFGNAFAAVGADYRRVVRMVHQRIVDVAHAVSIVMETSTALGQESNRQTRFKTFAERLVGVDLTHPRQLDLDRCLQKLFDMVEASDGALFQAVRAAELEIDENTDRIGSIDPDPVCTGALVNLRAKEGERFVKSRNVTVHFSPFGQPAPIFSWTPEVVTATVPREARSGRVYFAAPKKNSNATRPAELDALLSECPFLAGGAMTSMMLAALDAPLGNARCFLPNVGLPIGVVQSPRIVIFQAVTENGVPISDHRQPEPDDTIGIEWEIAADAELAVDIDLFADGEPLADNLPRKGRREILRATKPRIYTLRVASGCGTRIRRDLHVPVRHMLTFETSDISVKEGQIARLALKVDQPWSTNKDIQVKTSPVHPTADVWVTMPADRYRVDMAYSVGKPALPRTPALTVSIEGTGDHSSAVARIWMEPKNGTRQVVASQSGGPNLAAIDVVGVHAALTKTGKVLLFAYDESEAGYFNPNMGKSAVWDPSNNRVTSIPLGRNLFCAGHAFLGDGRLLVAGGQSSAIDPGVTAIGLLYPYLVQAADHDVHISDYNSWDRLSPDMPEARWYPTCMTLPDGRVLIVSGYSWHALSTIVNTLNSGYEIVDGATDEIVKRGEFRAPLLLANDFDVYPFLQMLPGNALFVHNHDTTWLVGLNGAHEPPPLGYGYAPVYNTRSENSRTYPGQGSCVMLPLNPDDPNKALILVVGGGGGPHGRVGPTTPASNTAEIFQYYSRAGLGNQRGWRYTRDPNRNQTFLSTARVMSDAVLLPDGTVAIIGGAGGGRADHASPPVMDVESFDPATEVFSRQGTITVPRLYHSTALLLPDGSVMLAGSTGELWHHEHHGGTNNEFRIEVYRPPYLYRGPQPTLIPSHRSLRYGELLRIEIPSGPGAITKAALLRHGSTTHTNNMGQRYIRLKISRLSADSIFVKLPLDGTIAPPGPYMLFVVSEDANGEPVPSVGALVGLNS